MAYRNDGTPAFPGDIGAGLGRGPLNLNSNRDWREHWDGWERARQIRIKALFDNAQAKLDAWRKVVS